jgi:rhodanese-related sulfurtransferase
MPTRLITLLATALLGAAGVVSVAAAADPAPVPASSAAPVSQADLLARIGSKDPDLVVLDVRTPAEYAAGHVPGALNIPHDVLASRIAELAAARDKQVVLYCRSGRRSSLAADVLSKAGFTRLGHLEGDYLAWEAEQRPIDR